MSGTTLDAILFLISTIFDLYIFVLIIRLILAWAGADYTHPITKFVVQLTSWAVKPLKRFLPDVKGIETSTIAVILIVELIKFLIISMLSFGFPNLIGLFILAFADAIKRVLELLFFAILLQAILSWVQPTAPINRVLDVFTSPIMTPLRRYVPTVGGVDISPIPALILLQLLIIIIVNPLLAMGLAIAVT